MGSPRLQRQLTICLRGHLSKQNSLDIENAAPAHVAFENEECEALNGRGGWTERVRDTVFNPVIFCCFSVCLFLCSQNVLFKFCVVSVTG